MNEETNRHDEKIDVANAMVARGGSFVSALGNALMRADRRNAARIKEAFPDYWKEYLEIAKNTKSRGQI